MQITILGSGTSQGIPLIGCDCEVCCSADERDKRLRASVMIEAEGQRIVIDSGPDFRQQMLNARVRHLDAILFTHAHRDHIAGLDDTRAFIIRTRTPFPIYAENNVIQELEKIFSYAFKTTERYPGVPEFVVHEINTEPFFVGNLQVVPIRGYHHKLPILGFRIGGFAYLTDINHIPEEEQSKVAGCQVLILDALQIKPHISHYSLSEALEVIQRLNPEKAYLTHISHGMGKHRDVSNILPKGIQLAYDGQIIQIN